QSGLNGDANTKKQAEQNIDDVAKAAKQAIDNTNGITDSENQAAKGQVDADANAAKEAIANADSTKAVTDAVNNGTVAINKDDANAAIDGALAEKNNSIDTAPNLTDEEKKAVKGQAKTVADSAKTAISNAKTVTDVESAKNTGVETINNINVPATSATKEAAKNAIDEALNKKKSEINGATNIDQPTKDKLIQDATDAATKAKNAIDQATTADAIKKAQDDGISNINNLNQGTDATKNKPVIPASKIPVGDQVTTVIITGDDYTYDDYAYNDFYQVIVKANAVQVYTLPKGNLTKEKKLAHDTTLTVLETKKIDGQVWYRIGTNRWIMAATTIKVGELENF
ncbi:DUF1542 domain-containing protein, partial [Lactobacillus kitasatonis]